MPSYSRTVKVPGKNSQELYDAVSQDIERFLSKAPIGKFDIDREPAKKEVRVKSPMFSATLAFADSEISLSAQLSLFAAPFRSALDQSIDRWLQKKFNLGSLS